MPRMSPPDPSLRYPKLRAQVQPRSITRDGHNFYELHDRYQLSEQQVGVPAWMAVALNYFDGVHDFAQIQSAVLEHYDFELRDKDLRALCEALNSALLLESQKSDMALAAALTNYLQGAYREPVSAGGSYPASKTDLVNALAGYCARANERTQVDAPPIATARAILSPHIDYARGGITYAQAWQQAAPAAQLADLVVIIGTDHYGNDLFTLTRQHYSSPFGVLPTARRLVDGLAESIGNDSAFRGELRHTIEHSLELPLVWLQYVRNDKACEILPILVGSLGRYFPDAGGPSGAPAIREFMSALHTLTAGRRVFWLASGDLSHVGSAFVGDPVDAPARALLQGTDGELLQYIGMGDAEGFYQSLQRSNNVTNVCGLSPFYLVLKQLGATSSGPIYYDTCMADETQTSFVTICGTTME